MALTIQQIISESDLLVPNSVPIADKIVALNAINGDFFNTVKIPVIHRFSATANQATFTLPPAVRSKDIDLVTVGLIKYQSLDEDNVSPLQNAYSYDDTSRTLMLSPVPYQTGLQGIVRYRRIATTTFLASALTAVPDAPDEYQWTYIPALASWLADMEDDGGKSSKYDIQYRNAWNAAAQNYIKEAPPK
ncbi:hypothetical protein WMW72_10605 [Paenibacillus filicis]|uniref:Uncharacterized protein n=1 Tax=Paenibacillus filicis TaxID=669464 RepID=A0ABU9DKQ5_9BACL